MESFFVPPDHITTSEISIQDEEFHHLSRVLRKREGDQLLVVNGSGTAYDCRIETITDDTAVCSIQNVYENYNEPKVNVTLMLPILKNHNRVEWIVEKGTELGVRRFVPVQTERSIPHRIRYDRLRKIARASMKQCHRSYLPEIMEMHALDDLLVTVDAAFDKVFIGHEGAPATTSMRNVYGQIPDQRVLLLAGPEGGFTKEEINACERNGGHVVSLGVRRYRAETAALIMSVYVIHD